MFSKYSSPTSFIHFSFLPRTNYRIIACSTNRILECEWAMIVFHRTIYELQGKTLFIFHLDHSHFFAIFVSLEMSESDALIKKGFGRRSFWTSTLWKKYCWLIRITCCHIITQFPLYNDKILHCFYSFGMYEVFFIIHMIWRSENDCLHHGYRILWVNGCVETFFALKRLLIVHN